MKWELLDQPLIDLYEKGTSRKLRLPEGIARRFVERVNRINAAKDINDLRIPPSMRFESLKGRANHFSIRLNDQYRRIFRIAFEDEEKLTGTVTILEISKHYE
jgi:toxin HigB-1